MHSYIILFLFGFASLLFGFLFGWWIGSGVAKRKTKGERLRLLNCLKELKSRNN